MEAERASRVKDEFVAMVSHELRTPLNAILGWTQLMMRNGDDRAVIERGLDVVARNTRLQAQLISDLLDISRIVSGKLRLEVQTVSLPAVIADALETVQQEALAKDVEIERAIEDGVGYVAGDPARLQQVVWNLLSNAVKFTPRGGRIGVTLRREGSHAEITVADTGAGIKAEFLPHIFDRFHQADRSITRRFGGLGLGLAIVKHLVELHGGTAHADSGGEGRGATFTIRLPTSGVQDVSGAEASSLHTNESYPDVALDGVRVLLVEDEADTREFVVRLLETHRAVVRAAASAAEALSLFAAAMPDIVISDIGLPGVDGYDLMERIRGKSATEGGAVPAIALTAYARAEDRTRALRAGYQAHLAKPVEPSELVATVAQFIDLSAVQHARNRE
jgi:CheY-like chemotaxis protein